MLRALLIFSALPLALAAQGAPACKCMAALSACNETDASDLVFIGTVESVTPMFLNRWNIASRESMSSLYQFYENARQRPSDESLTRLKNAYLATFPDLASSQKSQVESAKSPADIVSMFSNSIERGMRVHLRVKTLFKHDDDDDNDAPKEAIATPLPANSSNRTQSTAQKAATKSTPPTKDKAKATKGKDDDDDKRPGQPAEDESEFDIETPFEDCGYDFQTGETYLVYATSEEGSGTYSTGSCSRTRRLSDSGDDLTYLAFYKDSKGEAARLEGFATTDQMFQLGIDRMHDPQSVNSPAAGIVVALQSDKLMRYAETDRNGRFFFDGLPAGEYKISAYASGYPREAKLLSGPIAVRVAAKSCARQIMLLLKSDIQ